MVSRQRQSNMQHKITTSPFQRVIMIGIAVALSMVSAAAATATAMTTARRATNSIEIASPLHLKLPGEIDAALAQEAEAQYEAKVMESARIVGGTEAPPGKYPFFVRMETLLTQQKCGGSLVAPDVVLTAAHCNADNGQYAISVNGFKQTFSLNSEERRTVSIEKRPHPDFSLRSFENDYMLLKLRDAVPDFEPIVLNSNIVVPGPDEDLRVIGLGRLFDGGPFSISLQEVIVQHSDVDLCQKAYADEGLDLVRPEIMFCARGEDKDACQGDSGKFSSICCNICYQMPFLMQRPRCIGVLVFFSRQYFVEFLT